MRMLHNYLILLYFLAILDLLLRQDAAIVTAKATSARADEINKPSSNRRYDL